MDRASGVLLLILISLIFPAVQAAEQLFHDPASQASKSGAAVDQIGNDSYGDDTACLSCHRDQGISYLQTSHRLTSQLSNKDFVLGSFSDGSNVLMIADPAVAIDEPGLYFKMETREGSYYQTAVAGWPRQLQRRSERIDIVIGTGTRGQSYLYWHGNQLYELPVSYWSDGKRWINSPGYKNGTMNFSRPIMPRCLECHATYIQPLSLNPLTNRYRKESLVTGISCERCHGSGTNHILLHESKISTSNGVSAERILNPSRFSRDRQVDMCALCHNGTQMEEISPAFSFVSGDSLDNYFKQNASDLVEHPDVHGNQVGLLKRSRCYLSSPKMSCSTCHDIHAPERPAASYSNRCLNCHQVKSCGMSKTMGPKIADKCIDCHMPVETTNAINVDTASQVVRPKMRNHWIKIYP